jgi:hypothetical protein
MTDILALIDRLRETQSNPYARGDERALAGEAADALAELVEKYETEVLLGVNDCQKHGRYLYMNCLACRAEKAEQRIAELDSDATRYRWLRERMASYAVDRIMFNPTNEPRDDWTEIEQGTTHDEFDKIIDLALADYNSATGRKP